LKLIGAFKLAETEPALLSMLSESAELQLAVLQNLRQISFSSPGPVKELWLESEKPAVRRAAFAALASSGEPSAMDFVFSQWQEASSGQRRVALQQLTSYPPGAKAVVQAVLNKRIAARTITSQRLEQLQLVLGDDPALQKLLNQFDRQVRTVLRLNGADSAWSEPGFSVKGAFTIETWIHLAPGITNADSIVGVVDRFDVNFYQSRLRVWGGPGLGDIAVADRTIEPEVWTHIAVTHQQDNRMRLFINGEPVSGTSQPLDISLEQARLGWSNANGGTEGRLAGYRVWDKALTPAQIRDRYRQRYPSKQRFASLAFYASGDDGWGTLQAGASVLRTTDVPRLVTPNELQARQQKLDRYEQLIGSGEGRLQQGKMLARALCSRCHRMGDQGTEIGPPMTSVASSNRRAILRGLLWPDQAVKSGYRSYRVTMQNGRVYEGVLVSSSDQAVVLRVPSLGETRLSQSNTVEHGHVPGSLMPKGMLDGLSDQQAVDLMGYIEQLNENQQ
jgi:putative heme-binding domain-containing protein